MSDTYNNDKLAVIQKLCINKQIKWDIFELNDSTSDNTFASCCMVK